MVTAVASSHLEVVPAAPRLHKLDTLLQVCVRVWGDLLLHSFCVVCTFASSVYVCVLGVVWEVRQKTQQCACELRVCLCGRERACARGLCLCCKSMPACLPTLMLIHVR